MNDWQKVGIELPPRWKEQIADRARDLGCPMRYLWLAAIDHLLSLPRQELEQMVLSFELVARKDFSRLSEISPGTCHPELGQWLNTFVSSLGPTNGPPSFGR